MRSVQFKIRLAKSLDAWLGRLINSLAVLLKSERAQPPSKVRKLLFIKFWGLGSIILTEPALRWLKEAHSGVEVHFLTLRQNRELFALLPSVDKVYTLPFPGVVSFILRSLHMMIRLRRERYELVFDAEFFVASSALFAYVTGAPQIIGFSGPESCKKDLLTAAVPFSKSVHVATQFKRLVKTSLPTSPIRGSNEPQLLLPSSLTAAKPADRAAARYVVMNINASPLAVERCWPRERFDELARALFDTYGFPLVLIGSCSEKDYVASLEHSIKDCRVTNLAGHLNLTELADLISGALLLISNDSGPVHLASALQLPVVAFYGPETPQLYGPLSRRQRIFYKDLWCSPCMSLDNAKTVNCINDRACMKQIETDFVIREVVKFIDEEVLYLHRSKAAAE